MSRSRPRSFRRILLLRILLLSFPILLIGQYATLRKARTSLLDTARQNLASSAIRKAESFDLSLRALESHLQTLTQTTALQSGSASDIEASLTNFSDTFPFSVTCLQLTDVQSQTLVIDTCPTALPDPPEPLPWLTQSGQNAIPNQSFYLIAAGQAADMFPDSTSSSQTKIDPLTESPEDNPVLGTDTNYTQAHLDVVVATPVYGSDSTLRYTLSVHAMIDQLQNTDPRSLVGDTVIVDEQLRILVHPDPTQIGKTAPEVNGGDRLQSLVGNVWAGNNGTLHLFNFMSNQQEWLAGYTGLDVSVAPDETRRWTILAVTPLDHALQALWDIRTILIVLTLGLLGANAVLALYIARSLSLPIEKLGQYAEQIQDLSQLKEAPQDLKIWELNRLSLVLTRMMKRLEDRARELRHAWQDAQLANQLKNEFLANTSHELRTPLNAIIGCLRLVKDDCCDTRDEELDFLERADHAAIHLLKIINDILDIAKIESGTLALESETVNLTQVITEVIDLQSVQIQDKGLTLQRPDLSTPILVQADRAKLKQVLLNITYNALKFTEQGSIAIELNRQLAPPLTKQLNSTLSPTNPDQAGLDPANHETITNGSVKPSTPSQVAIVIRDTGIGIDPKQQHKLFRPFVMVDGSTTRRFEGTGLGLAISKNLMSLMAGTISLSSEGIGKGTTVTLTLPILAMTPDLTNAVDDLKASDGMKASNEFEKNGLKGDRDDFAISHAPGNVPQANARTDEG
ncbi:MAG: ATP-binding protein [Cyanobacteria bacterium P01_A01_bin.123]